jgi:5-methyltetrahydrofolate--homocysteine methyltransferase
MSANLTRIKQAVIDGKHNDIEGLVQEALASRADLERIINEGFIAAMEVVGQRFAACEIFVPEMLVSAVTMKKGLALIKPLLQGNQVQARGAVLIATVQGDLHDIGKNLVAMMLEGAGYQVADLGIDVSVDKVVASVAELHPDILGLSALLTTTMPEMARVVRTLEEKGLRQAVQVVVGGAPIDQKFADQIGADGYGKDAGEAVLLAKKLLGKNDSPR